MTFSHDVSVSKLIEIAQGWIGTPITRAGAVKGQGCNCVGLWAGVAREAGLTELWDAFAPFQGRERPEDKLALKRALDSHLIKTGDLIPGVILLLREHGNSWHIAGYTGNNTVIEAGRYAVVANRLTENRRIVRKYRVPGVDYG